MTRPLLYSFRRCPYAIRARMALASASIACELREVVLARKPEEMLALSPKATVPVLQCTDGKVIDESFELMLWALAQSDPDGWLDIDLDELRYLVWQNDEYFKPQLDRYKYFTRYPPHPQSYYLAQAEPWLQTLDQRLQRHRFLVSNSLTMADIALFPFIRQFARADLAWFEASRYGYLCAWMQGLEQSTEFTSVMNKYKPWQSGTEGIAFN